MSNEITPAKPQEVEYPKVLTRNEKFTVRALSYVGFAAGGSAIAIGATSIFFGHRNNDSEQVASGVRSVSLGLYMIVLSGSNIYVQDKIIDHEMAEAPQPPSPEVKVDTPPAG
jgi:hypothetical protein